jgi:hypothetical protein
MREADCGDDGEDRFMQRHHSLHVIDVRGASPGL